MFRVSLFGRLSISYDQQELTGLDNGKLQELVCYLMLHRTQAHFRERLAVILWQDQPQAKKYLRQTLWQLQSALDNQIHPAANLLKQDTEWVQINPDIHCWADVTQFIETYRQMRDIKGHLLEKHAADQLKAAAEIYRGDLLEGCYEEWCLGEREILQNAFLSILHKLVNYCEIHQEYETGIAYAQRILRCEPAHELGHRHLMRLYHLYGDRTAAVRQYTTCVAALRRELDVPPSNETVDTYNQIREDRLDPVPLANHIDNKEVLMLDVLKCLHQLQSSMTALQYGDVPPIMPDPKLIS